MNIKIIKAQTNGNDFIIIPNISLNNEQIKQICDRHYGIGCDQLIMFYRININTFHLKFYNNDGSLANMCGNGSCAFSLFVNKYIDKNISEIFLNVSNFNKENENNNKSHKCINKYVTNINKNKVNIKFPMPYCINNDIICTGNYHKVYSINKINNIKEIQKQYPECNIHFIYEINKGINNQYPESNLKYTETYSNYKKFNLNNVQGNINNVYNNSSECSLGITKNNSSIIKVITYERGAGRTLACGSGAIAIAFYLNNIASKRENHCIRKHATTCTNNSVTNEYHENITVYNNNIVTNNCNNSLTILHEGGISEVILHKNNIELITSPKIIAECYLTLNIIN